MKPIVHYTEVSFLPGNTALVKCIDHPHLSVQADGTQIGYTSAIVRRMEDGEFETNNTIYKKVTA